MLLRSLSQAVAVFVTACIITIASVAVALADPNPSVSSGNVTAGTDVAAPDQQNPIPASTKPVPQSAPTWPEHPQVLTPARAVRATSDDGFQWDDAGIGAGGALVVVLAGLGASLAIRRRQAADPPLPA